ncbi:MAG: hypothetical protein WEC34_07495 [Acidimicrobiia bacterium]
MEDGEIGNGVRKLVVAWLMWHRELDQRERARELRDRVEGYRVVDGEQTNSDGSWEITDAETGELLAKGVGIKTFDAVWQESWVHTDAIGSEAHDASQQPTGDFGLPHGMAQALEAWVVDQPDEALLILEP